MGGSGLSLNTLRALLRLLTVQASWNYERMVGLGLAFAMEPLLRSLPGGKENPRYRQALGRASQFFNAHPYFTGLAAGSLARAEHLGCTPEQADRLRRALAGPLGSVGDGLFWAGWLPLCSAVGLATVVLASPLAGVVLFLVCYNAAHLAVRWWALTTGWRLGMSVAGALGRGILRRGPGIVGAAAAGMIGFALPLCAVRLTAGLPESGRIGAALVLGVCVAVARWLVPSLGGTRVGMGIVALATVVALLWR